MSLALEDLNVWIKEKLFDAVPMGIAVIDRDFNLVRANRAFENMFGKWQGRKCYRVYKSRDNICPQCKGAEAFKDGLPRVNEEVGYNKRGLFTRYIKHTMPIVDSSGEIPYLLEMCTDITETDKIRREHQLLFDQVPCNILLIDRDFRIVKTNARIREMLGDLRDALSRQAWNHKPPSGLERGQAWIGFFQTVQETLHHATGHFLQLKPPVLAACSDLLQGLSNLGVFRAFMFLEQLRQLRHGQCPAGRQQGPLDDLHQSCICHVIPTLP